MEHLRLPLLQLVSRGGMSECVPIVVECMGGRCMCGFRVFNSTAKASR